MKYIMLILACFFVFRHESRAATFKSDETAVTLTGRQPGQSWYCHIIRVSDGSQVGNLSKKGGGSFQDGPNTVPSVTLSYDFYLVILRYYYTTDLVRVKWISAYEVGNPNEAQQSASGPYADNNTPSNDNGDPVNPATAQPPTNSFKACVTVTCPADALEPKAFKITGKANGATIYEQIVMVSPGETRQICVTNTVPFTLTAQEVLSRDAFDPDKDAVTGSDPNDPSQWDPVGPAQTVNSQGQSDPPASGSPQGSNVKTQQQGTPSQPDAPDVARPGTTEGNADARNQELRGELQRVTDQVKASGDATKAGIAETNKLLGEIKNSNGGAGDSTTGAALGTPSETGLDFATGVGAKVSGLTGALGNLMAAAGLSSNPGSSPLTWSIPVMGSTYTISLEEHAGVFSVVRTAILWVASVCFVWAAIAIARGTFVDEGAK